MVPPPALVSGDVEVVLPDPVAIDLAGLARLRPVPSPYLYRAANVPVASLMHVRVVRPIGLYGNTETGTIAPIMCRVSVRSGHGSQEQDACRQD